MTVVSCLQDNTCHYNLSTKCLIMLPRIEACIVSKLSIETISFENNPPLLCQESYTVCNIQNTKHQRTTALESVLPHSEVLKVSIP